MEIGMSPLLPIGPWENVGNSATVCHDLEPQGEGTLPLSVPKLQSCPVGQDLGSFYPERGSRDERDFLLLGRRSQDQFLTIPLPGLTFQVRFPRLLLAGEQRL
jgi:hypothetical protein